LLLFVCFSSVPASAQDGLGFYGIGGGLGFVSVSPTGLSGSSSGFGLNARVDMGEITTNLRLVPEISYWSVSEDITFFGETWEQKWSDFAINANVQYHFDVEGSFAPYVGGGLGLNFISLTVTESFFGETFSASASTTEFGINLIGGALLNLDGPISPFAEFRYHVVSNFNHLMILAGIIYEL
jgi:opacity protein-like surface antigen